MNLSDDAPQWILECGILHGACQAFIRSDQTARDLEILEEALDSSHEKIDWLLKKYKEN